MAISAMVLSGCGWFGQPKVPGNAVVNFAIAIGERRHGDAYGMLCHDASEAVSETQSVASIHQPGMAKLH